jgi:FMN hydrolase / 5-amino-6-(5-phospho-D-ribitylamino)uracil phosphatase
VYKRNPIKLITVDLDDTLWPCGPVLARAEATLYAWLEREAARLAAAHDLTTLREHRFALAERRPELAHDFTALRRASLSLLLEEFGYPPALAEEALEVFLAARNCVTPYPDVPPVLEVLRARYHLVSVTNGNAEVACTPLNGCFHGSLTAAGVGAAKPAPDIFHRALERIGADPGHAVHVGDDPRLDVAAAQQIGMRAVWVNRGAMEWPSELPPPDLTVRDLYALRDWLLEQ